MDIEVLRKTPEGMVPVFYGEWGGALPNIGHTIKHWLDNDTIAGVVIDVRWFTSGDNPVTEPNVEIVIE